MPGQPPRIVRAERLHLVLQRLHIIRNHPSLAHQRPNTITVGIVFFRRGARLTTKIVSKRVMAALMRVDEQMLLRTDRRDLSWIVSDDRSASGLNGRFGKDTIHGLDPDHRAAITIVARERHRLRVAASRKNNRADDDERRERLHGACIPRYYTACTDIPAGSNRPFSSHRRLERRNLSAGSDNHHHMDAARGSNRRDDDLVRRAAAGERDAFGAIYERYRIIVYRFARLMTDSSAAADDVTQEVFVTLMRALPQYDSHRADLATYLYGIARNVTRNRLRRERRFTSLTTVANAPSSAADPCAAASHSQQLTRLRHGIRRLPSRYREALILCDVHGLSYGEAAAVLDVPIGTVRSRLNRARARIAGYMHEESSGDRRLIGAERCLV